MTTPNLRTQLVDPSGRPLPPAAVRELQNSTAALRDRVGVLTEAIASKHAHLQNSLTGFANGLARVQGFGQDQVASTAPLYQSAMYYPISVDYTLMGYLYQTHGVLQTMIDEPVLDAFRSDDGPGFELTSKEAGAGSVGRGGLEELEAFAEEIGAWETLKHTIMWGGLYGGSGLVINAGQDPDKPLDEKDVRRGRLEFYDADRWEFSGAERSAKTFMFYGQNLDATRVITYSGKRAPRMLRMTLAGWGMSEIQRMVEDFNVWLRARNSLYSSIDKLNIDVYAVKDYANTLLMPNGEQTMLNRMAATNMILNFSKALILDSEDKYEVVNRTLTGWADIAKEIRSGLQGSSRIPAVKLWGSAASTGLSAEGAEMENEVYNAMVISRVRTPARPIIRKMLNLLMMAVYGRRYDVEFKFKSLRVLSAAQEEDIKASKTTRYISLHQARLLDSEEMGKVMEKEDLVPIETKAARGELPQFQEVPTTEQLFSEEKGENTDDRGSKADA